jgi:hypothetical protein
MSWRRAASNSMRAPRPSPSKAATSGAVTRQVGGGVEQQHAAAGATAQQRQVGGQQGGQVAAFGADGGDDHGRISIVRDRRAMGPV